MASLKDIAKLAGVSETTASKALNNYADVSEETKRKVRELAEKYDYTPNMAARNLARKKSNIIGLVLSDIRETDSNGNIIFRILIGAKNFCADKDFELLIISTDSKKQKDKKLAQLCRERQIAGVIIYGLKPGDPYFEEIAKAKLPCIAVDIRIKGEHLATVTTDNVAAVQEVVSHLYSKGHRNIAFINGLKQADVSKYRERGYRKALRELELPINESYIKYADYYEDMAYEKTSELINENPEVTAIFCASDLMALGALRAIKDLGKAVPGQVALVGFDGIQLSDYSSPRLTTVVQDFKEIGRVAAEKLIKMINNEAVEAVDYVPYNFRIRESI
ncbi:MAG: LacI family transcriptional regulator [Clostridia bacterium]|jgi:LacI family transcriptional regulator|nr:LacI family transcriptional regulator [Clostridia bacterium]